MNPLESNFTCKCGHPKDHHEYLSNFVAETDQDAIADFDESWCASNLDLNCMCDEYRPDNLKHLERLDADNSCL